MNGEQGSVKAACEVRLQLENRDTTIIYPLCPKVSDDVQSYVNYIQASC